MLAPVTNEVAVHQMYIALFGRSPDTVGLNYWAKMMESGSVTTWGLANTLTYSLEFKSTNAGKSSEDLVNQLYLNLFGRPAEPAGLTYWTTLLNSGASLAAIAINLTTAASGSDRTALDNKLAYAKEFVKALAEIEVKTPQSCPDNDKVAAASKSYLSSVISDASLATATQRLPDDIASMLKGVGKEAADTATAAAAAKAAAEAAADTPAAPTFTLTEASHAVTLSGTSTDAFAYTINGAATKAGNPVTASSGSLTNAVTSINTSGYSGTSNITLANSGDSVTGGSAVDTVAVGTLYSTGTLTLAGGANVITMGNFSTLSGTVTANGGTAALTIASGASVTMKAAHYTLFNTTGITAAGTEQITLSNALTSDVTLNSNVETFVLANAANTGVVTASSTTAQSIDAGANSAIISLTQTTAVLTTINNFTSTTDVIRLNGGTGAVTGQAVAAMTDAAARIVIDTAAALGASGVSIGNKSAYTNKINYAVASDTGAIYYDADGNWTAGSVQIGTVGTAVVAGDFKI